MRTLSVELTLQEVNTIRLALAILGHDERVQDIVTLWRSRMPMLPEEESRQLHERFDRMQEELEKMGAVNLDL